MKFYDAANWARLPVGESCCFYGDGRYMVPSMPQALAMIRPPEYRVITVTGNAKIASIVDGLPDNEITPAGVRAFVRARRGTAEDAIIYTPRSWLREYQVVLDDDGHGSLLDYSRLYWWIATLDGKDWTADELASDLRLNWEADITADRIWAVQNNQVPAIGPGATADQSELFLPWRP